MSSELEESQGGNSGEGIPPSAASASTSSLDSTSTSSGGLPPASLSAAQEVFLSAAKSLLVERQRFARMAGFNLYSDRRKIFEVLGYPEVIDFSMYLDRFERGGIAKRIVTAAPRSMGWVKIAIAEKKEDLKTETDFELKVNSLFERLNVGSILERADVLAGIGEYSAIYIGAKELKGVSLKEPLGTLRSPDDIVYLKPLRQDLCTITEWFGDKPDDDVSDPRYGLPKFYDVQIGGDTRRSITGRGSSVASTTYTTRTVHWSRVVHVTHNPLYNDTFSAPELEAIWNYLCDLDKLAGGGSEAAWKQAVIKTLFDLDKDVDPKTIDATTKDKLKDDLDEMMHELKSHVFSRGVTPRNIQTDVFKFGENVRIILTLIASTMDIPQRILYGSESGHLASTQDQENFNAYKSARADSFGTPLVRQLIDRLIKHGALPKPTKYDVIWPSEDEMSEPEKADLINKLAAANRNQSLADKTIIMTADEMRDSVYSMDPLPKPKPEIPPEPVVIPNPLPLEDVPIQ